MKNYWRHYSSEPEFQNPLLKEVLIQNHFRAVGSDFRQRVEANAIEIGCSNWAYFVESNPVLLRDLIQQARYI